MLLAYIKSFSHFKGIADLVDGAIVSTSFSISNNKYQDENLVDIINYSNKLNKEIFIDISSLMTNDELVDLDNFIYIYKDYNVNFIYTDIGVYEILKKYHIENRGIYDPKTLVTNSYDMNLYLSLNMLGIGLSNEIPASDIKVLNENKKGKTLLKVFGYHQMFYSKRHLLSTYFKFIGENYVVNRDNTFLKEETRGEEYHIDENKHGSVIYRSYVMSYLKEIDDIKDTDYLVLDAAFMDEDKFNEALKIYKDVLDGNMNKDIAILKLSELFDIEDGFLYNDTVYVKEEISR